MQRAGVLVAAVLAAVGFLSVPAASAVEQNSREFILALRKSGYSDIAIELLNDLKQGRHMLTALSTLTLEVYYRYLPLYRSGD
jgi:hypothetical protein